MAITTLYQGIEYRSRLEARWAAFFDQIGWRHTYEPFDGDGYIPDFLIHGPAPLLVEVKPAAVETQYRAPIDKVIKGLINHWQHDILIVGADPIAALKNCWPQFSIAGLLGEHHPDDGWWFEAANWAWCTDCPDAHMAVWHDIGYYGIRPCMNGRGDRTAGPGRRFVISAWTDACNQVKWHGRPVVA